MGVRGHSMRAIAVGGMAALLVTGAVNASIPSSTGEYVGCVTKATGALRVIDFQAGQRCNTKVGKTQEVQITWSQQGPAGEPGPTGAQGPAGPQGPAGQAPVPTTPQLLRSFRPTYSVTRGNDQPASRPSGWVTVEADAAIAASYGWTLDAASYPAGSTFRLTAGAFTQRISIGGGPTIPVQMCIRLASAATGPLLDTELCIDDTTPGTEAPNPTIIGDLVGSRIDIGRLTGPAVPIASGDFYVEYRITSGSFTVSNSPQEFTPGAGFEPVYIEVVPPPVG